MLNKRPIILKPQHIKVRRIVRRDRDCGVQGHVAVLVRIITLVLIMILALALVMAFPQIALWLPAEIYGL